MKGERGKLGAPVVSCYLELHCSCRKVAHAISVHELWVDEYCADLPNLPKQTEIVMLKEQPNFDIPVLWYNEENLFLITVFHL